MNKVDIIIISYNCKEHTLKCIESIYSSYNPELTRIIIVDNASQDNTVETIKNLYPDIIIIQNNKNLGYASAVNIGAKATKYPYFIISNPDVEYLQNTIKTLLDYLEANPTVGAVGPKQLYPDGRWQFCYGDVPGIKLGLKLIFFLYSLKNIYNTILTKTHINKKNAIDVGYIDGAVIATSQEAFFSINGFDEDYFLYTEELDFCYRLKRRGWYIKHLPSCSVTHFRGGSSAKMGVIEEHTRIFLKSKILFCKKHLSKTETFFYIYSEIIYAYELIMFWKVIYLFFKKHKEKANFKISTMKLFIKIWKDELRKLKH